MISPVPQTRIHITQCIQRQNGLDDFYDFKFYIKIKKYSKAIKLQLNELKTKYMVIYIRDDHWVHLEVDNYKFERGT